MRSLLNEVVYVESNNHYFNGEKLIILHNLVVLAWQKIPMVNSINNLFKQQENKHKEIWLKPEYIIDFTYAPRYEFNCLNLCIYFAGPCLVKW